MPVGNIWGAWSRNDEYVSWSAIPASLTLKRKYRHFDKRFDNFLFPLQHMYIHMFDGKFITSSSNFNKGDVIRSCRLKSPTNKGPMMRKALPCHHYSDVIMGTMVSQITGVSIVYSTLVQGIHRRPVNSPVTSEFPSQRASNEENVLYLMTSWRRHDHDDAMMTGRPGSQCPITRCKLIDLRNGLSPSQRQGIT